MQEMNYKFDSLKSLYRNKVLEVSEEPLVRMFALMQRAGNSPMFDTWSDREMFFSVETQLNQYKHIKEVKNFLGQTAQLRQLEQKYNITSTGKRFPTIYFADDTIFAEKHLGDLVYIEIRKELTEKMPTDVSTFQHLGIKTYIFDINDSEETALINRLGIVQFPANFVLNRDGIITAKNIWGEKLMEVVDASLVP